VAFRHQGNPGGEPVGAVDSTGSANLHAPDLVGSGGNTLRVAERELWFVAGLSCRSATAGSGVRATAMWDLVYESYSYYVRLAVRFWHTIGPYEYGGLLLLIGLIGWLLMKGSKR
jgi:hypothetical protein